MRSDEQVRAGSKAGMPATERKEKKEARTLLLPSDRGAVAELSSSLVHSDHSQRYTVADNQRVQMEQRGASVSLKL